MRRATTVGDLVESGRCDGKCLVASSPEKGCNCTCRGAWHGILAEQSISGSVVSLGAELDRIATVSDEAHAALHTVASACGPGGDHGWWSPRCPVCGWSCKRCLTEIEALVAEREVAA